MTRLLSKQFLVKLKDRLDAWDIDVLAGEVAVGGR